MNGRNLLSQLKTVKQFQHSKSESGMDWLQNFTTEAAIKTPQQIPLH